MSTRALIGRERELERLLEGLGALAVGRGSLFLLVGEPGIGKTRLADELGRHAEAKGAAVVWGAAWDGGGAPAYWPWIQVLRGLRPLVPEPDETLRRHLGPLWTGGSEEPGEPEAQSGDQAQANQDSHDPELARFRRYDALRAVLQAAANRQRLVVILEDLHAADRASLLALQLVARALRSLPVLLVATHRSPEALGAGEAAVVEALARLGREGTTLVLPRLGRAEVARMLGDLDPLPPRLLDDVFLATGGNPLFVDESLRLVRTGGRLQEVPAGVSALIRERLARFEAPTREALEAAAVLGRELAVPLLADACDLSVAELHERLRLPRAAGVLEPVEGAQRLRFAHGLYRERLVDDLTPGRRADLHLRAAEALLRRRAAGHLEAEEPLARHLLAAGPRADPALTVTWAVRAAAGAKAALAFDRAVALYEGALEAMARLPQALDPARRIDLELVDLELNLAEALVQTGAGPRSRALCLDAAAQARRAGDPVRLARAALAYGAELRIAVVDETLVALLAEALTALGSSAPHLRARVMARLAAARQPAPDPVQPMAEARAAIALARQGGDAETLLLTIYSAGSALVDFAPPEERLMLARELVALALPRRELTIAQRGYARIAIDCLEIGDRAEAGSAIAAHERLGQALGHARWRWRGALLRAMDAVLLGRWEQAQAAASEAEALIASADDGEGAATLAVHRLGARRAQEIADLGDLATLEGDTLADRAYVAGLLAPLRASLLARLGDREGAQRCLDSLPRPLGQLLTDPMALALLSDAVALVGDGARAAELRPALAGLTGRCLSWGVFGLTWEGPVVLWLGAMAAVCGHWDEAVERFEEALATTEGLGARPLAARARGELGRALRARNRPEDAARAEVLFDSAAAEAADLGMVHLEARLAALRDHPAARPGETKSPPAALPPPTLTREGEIWTISWQGQQTRLKHSRALELLAQLVENPGQEFHVLTLGSTAEPGEAIDTGDAGELLDDDARRAYRTRILELGRELAEASAWADSERRDRLRAELEFLEEELARGVGLGGRARRAGGAVERARSNVQKRLRGLIRKIGASLPALGHHLDHEIRTGTYVSYRRDT